MIKFNPSAKSSINVCNMHIHITYICTHLNCKLQYTVAYFENAKTKSKIKNSKCFLAHGTERQGRCRAGSAHGAQKCVEPNSSIGT